MDSTIGVALTGAAIDSLTRAHKALSAAGRDCDSPELVARALALYADVLERGEGSDVYVVDRRGDVFPVKVE
jgi:hypothetical protein